MAHLILLRHAKAEGYSVRDVERPLALRGRRQAAEVGAALALAGPVPDLALVSAATRTRQTWDILASRLPHEVPELVTEELYATGPRGVIELLVEVAPQIGTVIVVGHEPVMSATAALLAGPESDPSLVQQARIGIPTATRCLLEVPGPWAELAPGGATLVSLDRPAEPV